MWTYSRLFKSVLLYQMIVGLYQNQSQRGNLTLTLTLTQRINPPHLLTYCRIAELTSRNSRDMEYILCISRKKLLNQVWFLTTEFIGYASMDAMILHTCSRLWWMSCYPNQKRISTHSLSYSSLTSTISRLSSMSFQIILKVAAWIG